MKIYISREVDRETVAVILIRNGYKVNISKKVSKQDAYIEYEKTDSSKEVVK